MGEGGLAEAVLGVAADCTLSDEKMWVSTLQLRATVVMFVLTDSCALGQTCSPNYEIS